MRAKDNKFQKRLLAASISSCLFASIGAAAQEAQPVEEVLVLGVRGAIQDAINIKRDSATVVDAISAEDIGKLPDVTIADSLQRITGIQIRRSAGEGSSVNIRGLPQVVTQLNGEQYMGAGSVVSVQPQFSDIPSQLFSGAEVYKASTANLGVTGISGTINLQTRRPLDFDEGLTFAGSAEIQNGEKTGEIDPVVNGLINWKNDRFGAMANLSVANVHLANYYNGFATHSPTGDLSITQYNNGVSWIGTSPDDEFNEVSPQGFSAWNQVTERERLGLNLAFQADLGKGFELITEFFHTSQDEYNRKAGFNMTNKWSEFNTWVDATKYRRTFNFAGTPVADGSTNEWITIQEADVYAKRILSYAQSDVFDNESNNINIELNYDNGGPLTASLRYVKADATNNLRHGYIQGDLTDGTATLGRTTNFFPAEYCEDGDQVIGVDGGCLKAINPLGYTDRPTITYNTQGDHAVYSGFDRPVAGGLSDADGDKPFSDYMTNLDSYVVGAYSAEGNFDRDGEMDIMRADVAYEFDEAPFIKSIEAGVRSSERTMSNTQFHIFSPFYAGHENASDPNGCLVQWKATDVALNVSNSQRQPYCYAGESVTDGSGSIDNGGDVANQLPGTPEDFRGYIALPPTALDANNNVKFISDFGSVSGIPGVWVADPAAMDDLESFHKKVFGENIVKAVIPGRSYAVSLEEFTTYLQADFEWQSLSGNVGVRLVETDLTVTQNVSGNNRPYGDTAYDTGEDIVTSRSYTDTLPSLNLSYDVTEDSKLRFAYSKNMTQLDLNLWGDGITTNTSFDADIQRFVVNSVTLLGNPYLDPWRSKNVDLTYELYTGDASMLAFGFFRIGIESFPVGGQTVSMTLDDGTGTLRDYDAGVTLNGEGGSIRGWEFSWKQSLADLTDNESLQGFGFELNATLSDSKQPGKDITGKNLSFIDVSSNQYNAIGYYEANGFQFRLAYNYRDDRFAEQNGNLPSGVSLYQAPTTYIDVSASYDITDALTIYMNGSNITDEHEHYYLQWKDQYAFQNIYEPRYTLGLRAKF